MVMSMGCLICSLSGPVKYAQWSLATGDDTWRHACSPEVCLPLWFQTDVDTVDGALSWIPTTGFLGGVTAVILGLTPCCQ
jgi:hypothetical protein